MHGPCRRWLHIEQKTIAIARPESARSAQNHPPLPRQQSLPQQTLHRRSRPQAPYSDGEQCALARERERTKSCPICRVSGSAQRSEEHTSELQSLMRTSYAVFCLKKKKHHTRDNTKSKQHIKKN